MKIRTWSNSRPVGARNLTGLLGFCWLLAFPAPAPADPAVALALPATSGPAILAVELLPAESTGPEDLPSKSAPPVPEIQSPPPAVPPYPLVVNEMVESFIEFFQSEKKREVMGRWLSRSGKYLDMIKEVFREKGLPEELAYTAMIESGFNPLAVSRAGAHGLWQFMEATARRYGLTVNRWVDERLDPAKSTVAAANYFRDLFEMFGHWFLAQAAYNAGEMKVARALALTKSPDFWGLTRSRYLKTETKQFVPLIVAATLIAKDPVRFGFEVVYQEPDRFDVVTVSRPTELRRIAKLAGTTVEELRALNPALKVSLTPLDSSYDLRVPHGTAEAVAAGLAQPSPEEPVRWVVHRTPKGQRIEELARLYGTPPARIAEVNHLARSVLRAGTDLLIPVMPSRPREKGAGGEVHVVRQGETLGAIARLHGVAVDDLVRWNRLASPHRLRVGEPLRLRPPDERSQTVAASLDLVASDRPRD